MRNRKFTAMFYVVVLLLFGMQSVLAEVVNPPASLLQTPSHTQDKVLSIFSNAYTNEVSISNISGNSNATIREVRNVLGSDMIYVQGGMNAWENVIFNKSVNISEYDSLTFDIYVVSGPFDLKIQLAPNTTGYTIVPRLQEGWTRVKIKLTEFTSLISPPNLASVSQINFINNGGYARTIYVDNIYVFGSKSDTPIDPQLPATPAPTPKHAANTVKSIFSDAYTDITDITSFSGTGIGKILSVSPGNTIMKIENGLNHWANIHFNTINIDDKDSLHLDVFVVRESGSIELRFAFDDGFGVAIARTLNPGWNYINISLTELKAGSSFSAVSQLRIIRTGGYPQTVFIDNIYTYGTGGGGEPIDPIDPTIDPNAPKTPAPTPIHAQDSVKSIFSDAYTSVASLVQTNPGQPTSTMTTVKASADDEMIRFTSLNWTLIRISPELDLDNMDYLHMDIYAEGTPRLKIGLGDGKNESIIPEQNLEPGWKSFDIPISLFRDSVVDLTKLNLLRMYSASGFAISRLYFDNIYAFKGDPSGNPPSFEIASAPEPIMAPATVKSIYTDKYLNLTDLEADEIGVTTKFKFQKLTDTDMTIRMVSLDLMKLRALTTLNISDMDAVHFSVYKDPAGGNASLEIGFQAKNSSEVYYSSLLPTLTDKEWTYVNIPVQELVSLGLNASAVEKIVFRGSGNIYIDNIFSYRGEYALGLGEEGRISVDWAEASKSDELPDINLPFLGVNLSSASGGEVPGVLGQNYNYPTFQDLYYFKSKGVRLIRFPFKWERIQHELNGPLDVELDLMKMNEVIAEAERIGMYVMPDMHNYCRRRINGVTHKFGESAALTKDHFADVWKKLAKEWKSFNNIWGYDLMNEPYGLSPGVWAEAAQAAIDSIRIYDANTPIVIEGESYASASTWPTTGGKLINLVDPSNKIIFQAHTYFDRDKSGLYKLGNFELEVLSADQPISRIKPFADWLKANNVKGILGEFGVPRNDVRWLNLLDEVLAYLKENGISGTYWIAGNGSSRDQVSVQPLENYTIERAQMRVLEKYIPSFHVKETGIDDITTGNKLMNIYPNPILDKVIVYGETELKGLNVYDLAGKLIRSVKVNGRQSEINLNDVASGVYLLQVHFQNGMVKTKKVVKM